MYHYIVEFWDSDEHKMVRESGLVASSGYETAAGNLVHYFGHNLISMQLTEWENPLSEEEILDGFTHEVDE